MNTGEIILLVLGVIIIVLVAKGKPLWTWMKEKERLLISVINPVYLTIGTIVTIFLFGIFSVHGPVCTVSFLIIVVFCVVIQWEANKPGRY